MKNELSSVDLEVKRMMLDYPDLFPTRIHCLLHLFSVIGNGYDWQSDGTMKDYDCRSGRTPSTPMPDHIHPAEQFEASYSSEFLETFSELKLEYDTLLRNYREKHIDYLCQQNLEIEQEPAFTRMYPMSENYSPMCEAAKHPHRIADDWREAIRELINWFLPLVNSYYGLYQEPLAADPNVDLIGDARVKQNYIICQQVLKNLKTDQDRKDDKLRRKILRKTMYKINSEEK